MSNIEQRVIKVVADQLGQVAADIKLSHDLKEDLGADSLDSVELVMAIEDEFEIEVEDTAAESLTTVQSIVDYLTPRVKA